MKSSVEILDVQLTGETYAEGLVDVAWIAKEIGYGHISFKNVNGKIHCSSEGMGRNFVKSVLNKLVDVAIFENEKDLPPLN